MQLRKNPPFEIDPNDPFQNDTLEHKSSIELLTKLVQSTEQPFVITVEAPWGWGKTKFIERWKAYLVQQKHVCLYFNAWENDFVSDPLVAFIGELRPVVENADGGKNEDSPVRKGLARLQKLGTALAKRGAPILVKAVVSKALGSEAVKDVAGAIADSADDAAEFVSETVKEQIENYDEEKKGIQDFRETLKELAEKVTSGDNKPKQLVFFVDELDRCRPDFAMTLLERMKHLFNVEKVVFFLTLDSEQL
jgi:predicted KAP-like P-loop ATPase